MRPEQFNRYWRWFFFTAALEAGAAFFILLSIPHGGSSFSLSRLAILGLLAGLALLWAYFGFRLPHRLGILVKPVVPLISAILSLTFSIILFLLAYLDPERLLPYYQRLNPLLFYLFVFFLQMAVWVLLLLYGIDVKAIKSHKPTLISASVGFLVLLAILLIVAMTHLGFTPDPAYWGEPGVPVLGWQAAAAVVAGLAVLLLSLRLRLDRDKRSRLLVDLAFVTVIWLIAIALWLSVPMSVMQNSFYAPMGPPSNQPYPNSDAAYYDDHAQSALLGMGYLGDIPTRPLYILFLVVLHALFGQNYGLILAGQTCVLALLPVVLYLLGTKLHSRAAGVMAALFAIFRELTTLWISSNTRVSNTRTLMSDLPTTLMIVVACLIVMRWLERRSNANALIAGGVFGALLLLRTQSIVILPFMILLALMAFRPHWRKWLIESSLLMIGVIATVAPWLIHNYLITGKFTFDDPSQLAVISSQYALTNNLDTTQFNNQSQSVFGNLLGFAVKHPGFVAGFITNHFLATEIGGLWALPLVESFAGIGASINIYWFDLPGHITWYNLLLLIFYLALIGLGLGAAWRKQRWVGLMPLVFNIGYALANGIGRFSGWRYDLPADWIAYFYLSIGVAVIFHIAASLFGAKDLPSMTTDEQVGSNRMDWRAVGPILAGLAIFGSLPWILEVLPPPHFLSLPESTLVSQLASAPGIETIQLDRGKIQDFLNGYDSAQFNPEILQGRALYPRFFLRNEGIIQAHPLPAYAVRNFARVGFLLMNRQILPVVFPTRLLPSDFPQGADVIVLGCKHSQYIEAKVIAFEGLGLVYQNGSLSDPCLPYNQ